MQGVISAIQVTYYPLGAQVMTLVLPLGFFIVVMTALYFVFTRPHTVPGRRPIRGARPVAPAERGARGLAGRRDRPADRDRGRRRGAAGRARRTQPPVGVRTEDAIKQAGQEAAAEAEAAKDKVTGESGKDQDAATEGSEDQE